MLKIKKVRLKNLYFFIWFFIFAIVVSLLGFVSVLSLESIGLLSIKISTKNIEKVSYELISSYNQELGEKYEFVFMELKKTNEILLSIAQYNLDNFELLKDKKAYYVNDLKLFKKNGYFLNSPLAPFTICYWGKENIEGDILYNIISISYFNFIILRLQALSPNFYLTWIENLRDKYFIAAPNIHYDLSLVSRDAFEKYFNEQYLESKKKYSGKSNYSSIVWSNPRKQLIDKDKLTFCTYVPYFSTDGEFVGYVGIDVLIDRLKEYSKADLKEELVKGDTFLLTNDGVIVFFPDIYQDKFGLKKVDDSILKEIYKTPYFEFKNSILSSKSKSVKSVFQKILNSKSKGIFIVDLDKGEKFLISFFRLKTNNWVVGSIIPVNSLYDLAFETQSIIKHQKAQLIVFYIVMAIFAFMVLLILSTIFFKYFVLKPVDYFSSVVKKLGKGNFEVSNIKTNSVEFSILFNGLHKLGKDLLSYTETLKKETTEKTMLYAELGIAAQIQNSILPKVDKRILKPEFDLAAAISPAEYVSGDFYDFFYLKDNLLAIIIGDISGKGVYAAIYMAIVKYLLKSVANREDLECDTVKIMKKTNSHLCRDNETGMFATVQLIIYNIETGEFSYTNAGHHELLKVKSNGEIESINLDGTVLGLFNDSEYKKGTDSLQIGDFLLLYTDGVSEATNKKFETFGETRIKDLISRNLEKPVKVICEEIIREVRAFEDNKISDDITLLCLKRKL